MALVDNLISYWSLEEASGNALDAKDSNDLTDQNTCGSTTGKVGNCRTFSNASQEYFNKTSNASLQTGDIDFTFAAWFYLTDQAVYHNIIGKWQAGQLEYILYWDFPSQKVTLAVSADGTNAVSVAHTGTINTATWYHVVAWHDSVNNQIGISINDGTPDITAHSGGVRAGTADFEISGAGSVAWDGRLDEVGFWKRVLTSGERTDLYNSGSGRDYAYIAATGGTAGNPSYFANQ